MNKQHYEKCTPDEPCLECTSQDILAREGGDKTVYKIPFTQYLFPDGRTRPVTWECSTHEQEIKARALIEAGARFEIEMLSVDRSISITCEMVGNDGEPHTLAHELSTNDKTIIEAIDKVVNRAHETFINGGVEMMP